MVRVACVDDSRAEGPAIELDEFSHNSLYSGIAEKLEEAFTEVRPSQQFELSREEIARDYRRLSID